MARRSSVSSMPRAWRSTGPCVHAAWPRMSPREGHARRRLEARAVAREVARAQEPAHPFGERADGGGDVPAVEAVTRGRDARRPVAAPARVGLHEPAEGAREGGLHEELAHAR